MYDAPMVVHTTTSQCMSPLTGFCIFLCWAFVVAVSWILYEKAGKRGWAVIIPFYGKYVKADIAFGNGWLFLLSYVPIARWFYGMIANCEFAEKYTNSTGLALGTAFFPVIFLTILAFDSRFNYRGNN